MIAAGALFAVVLLAGLAIGPASARAAGDDACGPYATAEPDDGGNAICRSLSAEARRQIIRARQLATEQYQRARQLEIEQRQRATQARRAPDAREQAIIEREKLLAREQRQPEEQLKQETRRRYWPQY